MRSLLFIGAACVLAACAAQPGQPSPLASPAGQIFCAIQLNGGGQIVAGLATVAVNGATKGVAAPLVTVGATVAQNTLDNACNAAAAQVPNAAGSTGAVPAPAMPVQTVVVPAVPAGTAPAS